jgi:hypothetical protein
MLHLYEDQLSNITMFAIWGIGHYLESYLMSRPIFRERILCGPPLSCLSDVQIRFSYASKSKLSGLCFNDPPPSCRSYDDICTRWIQDLYTRWIQDEYKMNTRFIHKMNTQLNKWTNHHPMNKTQHTTNGHLLSNSGGTIRDQLHGDATPQPVIPRRF